MSYKQAREDFEYLETIKEIDDTVDQMSQLTDFMENPTKIFAESLYRGMILQWFTERRLEHLHCGNFYGQYEPGAKEQKIMTRYKI